MQEITAFLNAILWPAIGAGSIWYFRDQIKDAFPRLNKLGPIGFEPKKIEQAAIPVATATADLIEEIKMTMSPALLAETRVLLEAKLPKTNSASEETEMLKTVSAGMVVAGIFEKTNAVIWGSQLAFLQLVNSAPQKLEAAQAHYKRAKEQFPLPYTDFSFEQWFHFLEQAQLVLRQSTDDVIITIRGHDFLTYLVRSNYPMIRPN